MPDEPIPTNGAPAAMLVSLSFGLPRQSFKLEEEARKIEEEAGASNGVASASLWYFKEASSGRRRRRDGLGEIKRYMNSWRAEHNKLTKPWDSSSGLLPAALAQRYMDMDAMYVEDFPAVKNGFMDNEYYKWRDSAPTRLGKWAATTLFPSDDECQHAISFTRSFLPLPDAEAWKKIGLIVPDLAATIEGITKDRVDKAVLASTGSTYLEILKRLNKVATVLGSDKTKVYDAMIEGLIEMADLAPAFNLKNNGSLNALAKAVGDTFRNINVEDIRKSAVAKADMVAASRSLIESFTPMARQFAEIKDDEETAEQPE